MRTSPYARPARRRAPRPLSRSALATEQPSSLGLTVNLPFLAARSSVLCGGPRANNRWSWRWCGAERASCFMPLSLATVHAVWLSRIKAPPDSPAVCGRGAWVAVRGSRGGVGDISRAGASDQSAQCAAQRAGVLRPVSDTAGDAHAIRVSGPPQCIGNDRADCPLGPEGRQLLCSWVAQPSALTTATSLRPSGAVIAIL